MQRPYRASLFGHVLGGTSLDIQFLKVIPLIPRQAAFALVYHSSLLFSSAISLALTALLLSVQ